ncbi:AraC family transcriptional regulator [Christiangramia sediminis]|uniref:Helix-turn-helix domain-containing protein n=1 Tax=Christiangramia sediminis TaxID=2881336 RepID=A0A9X1LK74_9FLAO|nr:AraC family transcriptional regulator [Christiangramia sediminis]MCB7481815.1 helix-turn-helix domain-containing protein [Christiangramia sediminis]
MRFFKLTFLLYIFITFNLTAQKDSLETKTYEELKTLIGGFEKEKINFELIDYYRKKAINDNNLEQQLIAKSLFIEGSIWSRNFDTAQDSLKSFMSFASKHELKSQSIHSLFQIGQAYFYQGIWGKAIENYSEALKLSEETNDKKYQHKLLLKIGYIRSTIGDPNEALSLHKRGLEILKNSGFDATYLENVKATNFYYLSLSYKAKNQKDSAIFYMDKALQLVEKAKDTCQKQQFLRKKAEIEIMINKLSSAENNLKRAIVLCRPLSKLDSLVFYGNFGELYLAKKQFKKAQIFLQEALEIYQVKKDEEGFMVDHYKLLAKAYKHTGDIEKSNFYLEKYINTVAQFGKIRDTVNQSLKQQEVEDFKNELAAIKEEKNLKQTYLNYLFLGASLIILLLLVVLLRFYRNKKKNEEKFEALMLKIESTNELDKITNTKDEVLEEKSSTDVPEETKQQILEGLKKLEQKEYFLKQECNSYNVARKINTNTSYLSKVINSHFGKNFNSYINDLRINYAIVRLKNDVIFRSYSIQSIAEEVGYKSADSFTKYFKLNTGLNPSFYIKEIKNIG